MKDKMGVSMDTGFLELVDCMVCSYLKRRGFLKAHLAMLEIPHVGRSEASVQQAVCCGFPLEAIVQQFCIARRCGFRLEKSLLDLRSALNALEFYKERTQYPFNEQDIGYHPQSEPNSHNIQRKKLRKVLASDLRHTKIAPSTSGADVCHSTFVFARTPQILGTPSRDVSHERDIRQIEKALPQTTSTPTSTASTTSVSEAFDLPKHITRVDNNLPGCQLNAKTMSATPSKVKNVANSEVLKTGSATATDCNEGAVRSLLSNIETIKAVANKCIATTCNDDLPDSSHSLTLTQQEEQEILNCLFEFEDYDWFQSMADPAINPILRLAGNEVVEENSLVQDPVLRAALLNVSSSPCPPHVLSSTRNDQNSVDAQSSSRISSSVAVLPKRKLTLGVASDSESQPQISEKRVKRAVELEVPMKNTNNSHELVQVKHSAL